MKPRVVPWLACLCLASMATAGQEDIFNQHLPPGRQPGWWQSQMPLKTSSKTWIDQRKAVDKQIGFWVKASAAQRLKAIDKSLSEHAHTSRVSPAGAYTLARLALRFPNDFVSAKAMARAAIAQSWTAGSNDPEFIRHAFVLRSLYGGGVGMEVAAEGLLNLFPNDIDVQHAYVKEACQQRKPSWTVVQRGMKVLESLLKQGAIKEANAHAYWSNLWMAAYDATNKLSHLKEAIRRLEESVRLQSDPEKRQRTEMLLEAFKKKLAQGKYVSG